MSALGPAARLLGRCCRRRCQTSRRQPDQKNAPVRGMATEGSDGPTVRVRQGALRGRRAVSKLGGSYLSFQGVPYGRAPVGALRFKPPEPAPSWEGVRDALKEGAVCPHRDWIQGLCFRGDEDCLFLNVYTPEISSKGSSHKPVMVWIHGGGYYIGSGNTDMYGPDYLVQAGVVVVTMNYRLGALGFLSLEDSHLPGNMGLRDQVAALRWVRENIEQFGGDPNNVTIFGESAGGACVMYHMMSPMTEGLFHKAIIQSGSVFNPWGMASSSLRTRAFKLGEVLGFKTADPLELLQFLRTVTPRELVEGSAKTITNEERRRGDGLSFNPIPETEVAPGEEIYLPGHPSDLLREGKFHRVPLIAGVTSHEGILDLSGILKHPHLAEVVDKDFSRHVPTDLNVTEEEGREIAEKMREFYLGGERVTMDTLEGYSNILTDLNFVRGVDKAIKMIAEKSTDPIYYYKFSFDGELGVFKKFIGASFLPGASHIDDLGYLFRVSSLDVDIEQDSPERGMINKMVKMWTNFAKYGNPTPETDSDLPIKWAPYTAGRRLYLNIDTEFAMEENIFRERLEFWNNLYKMYNK